MRVFRFFKMLLIGLLACTVMTYVVMRLWNWLMPGLTGWHTLTFWQSLGLLVLCKILFGGFHKHGGHRGRRNWKREMKRKFAHMSPEERERFRAGMRGRWAHCRPDADEFRAHVEARWGREKDKKDEVSA